ncbi:MAG: permease [Candidatus Acetothermia bacterium]|nr:permease [Candidatus Acetothermia bacterium]MDH7505474.1 permease [Candidatus Acetothermia bacterium]
MLLDIWNYGWGALVEYLSAHVLTCLVPAFFIAGAIGVFVAQGAILRYFGAQTKRWLSYSVASVSGAILAVCSCTILPLFAGIYKRGAGLGPAVAFLFSGPAINILAIVYSARLLGYDIGLARAIGAVVFAIVIGLLMATLFRREDRARQADERAFAMAVANPANPGNPKEKKGWQLLVYFAILVGILVCGAGKMWVPTGILLALLGLVLYRWFSVAELKEWLLSTWAFVKLITPWLLGGVFIAGIIRGYVPQGVITGVVGKNSLLANLVSSLFGAFFYFATLTEVPIVKSFMELGMAKGPVLALLLAGPALSLPSMLVIRGILGTRKTITYVTLVVIMATLVGLLFGKLAS